MSQSGRKDVKDVDDEGNSLIPFNEKRHENALAHGHTHTVNRDDKKNKRLILDYRAASQLGLGYGTAALREHMKVCLTLGYEGNLHTVAAYSSHIFWLKMGMIPIESTTDVLLNSIGATGTFFLHRFRKLKHSEDAIYQNPNGHYRSTEYMYDDDIKNLFIEDNGKENPDLGIIRKVLLARGRIDEKDKLTEDLVWENYDFLGSVLDEEGKDPYIRDRFIPSLLNILETDFEQRPNTKGFCDIHMQMSEEGKARWKHAIENDVEFNPFRKFEQLQDYMTPDQKIRMARALALREQKFEEIRREASAASSQVKDSAASVSSKEDSPGKPNLFKPPQPQGEGGSTPEKRSSNTLEK